MSRRWGKREEPGYHYLRVCCRFSGDFFGLFCTGRRVVSQKQALSRHCPVDNA